jgi:hypothetical protein
MATDEPKSITQETTETKDQVVDETSQETPKQTAEDQTTGTKEVKEETSEVDVEKITETATKRAEERVAQRLLDALGVTKEEKTQAEWEGLIPPWEKEGRNPKSYKEVAEFSAQLAEWKLEQTQKAKEEEEEQAKEQQKQTNEQWNKYWDDQLDELVASGKLPKVEDSKDPNDPGVVARKVLFQSMFDISQERLQQGKPAVTSLKEIFYEHYKDPNAQPAGYDAPISLGKRAVSTGEKADYSYNDIHGSSYSEIIAGKK